MMQTPYQIASTESKDFFLDVFGSLYEDSPWVVERCYESASQDSQYDDIVHFHELLSHTMSQASDALKMELILAHPRLAGKKAQDNQLTDFSTEEQKAAGLSHCSDEELTHITQLNEAYFSRYGFDFIMAVKEKNKVEILQAFESRLHHSKEQEMATALAQINQIAWLRLKSIYTED